MLYESGNIAQTTREMAKRGIDIMGISETHCTGYGRVQLQEGETIIYSGRQDNIHRQVVGTLMLSASKALIDWSPMSERIVPPKFYSNDIKLTLVQVEFYATLQDVPVEYM